MFTYQVVKYDIEPTILYIISIHIYVYTNNLKNLFIYIYIYIYTIQAAQRVLATKGKGRGMRGGSNKKKFGRRNKKQPRHMKGSKTSPTMREEERWDDITGAYGNLPGVEPVRATPGGGSNQMLQQQKQEQQMQQQQEQMQQQQQQQSTVEENMIVNDNENKLTNNDNNAEGKEQQEAVDLDSLVNADSQPVKDMITPRRGGEEKDGSDEVDEGKKE